MRKNIYEECNIDAIIRTKERAIIELYAKRKHIDRTVAEGIYMNSKLRNIIRDKESDLYLESAYYILNRYSEYLLPRNIDVESSNKEFVRPASHGFVFPVGKRPTYLELPLNEQLNTEHLTLNAVRAVPRNGKVKK